LGKPKNIQEPEKELRFTRSRQAITFVAAGLISLCILGFIWFQVYFNGLENNQNGPLIFPILCSIILITMAVLFFLVAIHCTQHALIILSPLGLELFPFWFPVKNFRMLYWSEINDAKINKEMNLLSIDCNNGSKIFISIKPIPTKIRSYLKTAIDGRMQEKHKDT
jgi:hypothetical protein